MNFSAISGQLIVGLSHSMILFIVSAGLSLILGVLRVPNIAHGSMYMIGAFCASSFTVWQNNSSEGFWIAMFVAPLIVALIGLILERWLLCHLYQREHLMLILFTFGIMLILNDMVKLIWGSDFRSMYPPSALSGAITISGLSFPRYNLLLFFMGPLVAFSLWFFVNKTKLGKISRAAAVDREMVGVLGINVSWVSAFTFVLGSFLAGLGGALVAPTTNISVGMDHALLIEGILIVTIGGLGNIWGALIGSLIFGITQSLGLLLIPQFSVVFPYLAVVIVLAFRPRGLLRSAW